MKRLLSFVAGTAIAAFVSVSSYGEPINVTVNIDKTQSTLEGWGVSLCWWAHMCGQWKDESKIDTLVDWLVSPDGLNYNVFRYNIGGGDEPSHLGLDGHTVRGKGFRAQMPGFKPGPDSDYDWNADSAQIKIMLKIKEKRPDAIFEAFSNSAPYWMTYSGCASGNFESGKDNLKPEYYEAFCTYLVDVCKHIKDTYGIEFKTLEPFNESNTNYWGFKGSQEGCHFDIATQITIIRMLAEELKESGLETGISAADETNVGLGIQEFLTYKEAGILPLLTQYNVHTYGGNAREKERMGQLARNENITLWMSETGSGGNGFEGNLNMAARLIEDVNTLQPTVWCDWQYMEELNDQWCFVRGNFKDEIFYKVPNFDVRQKITAYIKPGYTFVSLDSDIALQRSGVSLLGAVSPDKKELVVVAINRSKEAKQLLLSIDSNACGLKIKKAHSVTLADSYKETTEFSAKDIRNNGGVLLNLDPQTICTCICLQKN